MSSNRRQFLRQSGSCSALLMSLMAWRPGLVRSVFSQPQENEKLFEEKWGWIEKLSENVWSHISTPFETRDYTTVCNGGFIVGSERILVVESFQQPKGAKWVAERCKELTGRWPTDIVLTHYHGDHTSGSQGFKTKDASPTMWITEETKQRIERTATRSGRQANLLEDISTIPASESTTLDLGGVSVKLEPLAGHTGSDVMIEVVDPNIIFSGDLFWNRLVPNFVDAKPTTLAKNIEGMVRQKETLYVPGHGTMASGEDITLFQEFLEMMDDAAKKAHAAGSSAAEAAKQFKLQGKFEDWFVFSPRVVPGVFAAWYKELDKQ